MKTFQQLSIGLLAISKLQKLASAGTVELEPHFQKRDDFETVYYSDANAENTAGSATKLDDFGNGDDGDYITSMIGGDDGDFNTGNLQPTGNFDTGNLQPTDTYIGGGNDPVPTSDLGDFDGGLPDPTGGNTQTSVAAPTNTYQPTTRQTLSSTPSVPSKGVSSASRQTLSSTGRKTGSVLPTANTTRTNNTTTRRQTKSQTAIPSVTFEGGIPDDDGLAQTTGGNTAQPTGGNTAQPTGGNTAQPTGGDFVEPTGGDFVQPTGGNAAPTDAYTTRRGSTPSGKYTSGGQTGAPSPTGAPPSTDFATEMVNLHNEKRRLHQDTPDLSWDETVAASAQAYADKYECSGSLTHSYGQYGENLAVGYKTNALALAGWYDEIELYNYSNQGFTHATGHFTQYIWKSTTGVGCGIKECGSYVGTYIVCQYSPAGNVQGQFESNVMPLK